MKQATISKGGQISVPADVRRRWGTSRVLVEDLGDSIVLRPIRVDPIGAAIGSLAEPGPTSDAARATLRQDEAATNVRRCWRPR